MTRYLVCLAIFSVAVDLARQVANPDSYHTKEEELNKKFRPKERMKREVRRELIQEKFASLGLAHPTTLPLRFSNHQHSCIAIVPINCKRIVIILI